MGDAPLPTGSAYKILESLDCSDCNGWCCSFYKHYPTTPKDLKRIFDNVNLDDVHIGSEGCVFLKDGRCSIYEFRPEFCRLYPIQENAGKMYMRLRCQPAIDLIRKVIKGALMGRLLLPDLRIVEDLK